MILWSGTHFLISSKDFTRTIFGSIVGSSLLPFVELLCGNIKFGQLVIRLFFTLFLFGNDLNPFLFWCGSLR